MSFFPKTGRFTEKQLKEASLGPGEYLSHKDYRIAQAMVPFGSMVERVGPADKKEVMPLDEDHR